MKIIIGVDRVRFRHCYSDSLHGLEEYKVLHEWKEVLVAGDFGKYQIWKTSKLGSLTKISLCLPEGGKLLIMFGHAGGKQSLWFQFNSQKLSPCDWDALKAHMGMLLFDGFKTLVTHGTVSDIEIAIDVRGVSFADFMYVDESLRSGDSDYEKVGTTYLGSQKSNRRFTCYDKSKEQDYKGIYAESTLRLEAKLQEAKAFLLSKIESLPSPFQTLMVIDRQALSTSTDPLARKFWKRVNDTGVPPQEVYFHMPLPERKALQAVLRTLQPVWWTPSKIWTRFPDSLDWMLELFD